MLGLKWLKEGRVSDLVILGVAGIDQGIPSAPLDARLDQEARGRENCPVNPPPAVATQSP